MKRIVTMIMALVLIVAMFTAGSFANDFVGSSNEDFTVYYSEPFQSITRQYFPYTADLLLYKSKAKTVLNNVNVEYEEHYAYVCIYDVNGTSRANWSYTISNNVVDSGWAYTDSGHHAKKVVHYAEKAYDIYNYNTYRFTAN